MQRIILTPGRGGRGCVAGSHLLALENYPSGTSGFLAPVVIPAALFAFTGFYQQVVEGTTLHHAFLVADRIANKGMVTGQRCFADIYILISLHGLLPEYLVGSVHQ